jgi:hypothetical protein
MDDTSFTSKAPPAARAASASNESQREATVLTCTSLFASIRTRPAQRTAWSNAAAAKNAEHTVVASTAVDSRHSPRVDAHTHALVSAHSRRMPIQF